MGQCADACLPLSHAGHTRRLPQFSHPSSFDPSPPPPAHAQSRPAIFDLEIRCPDVLYETVVECDEQVVLPLGDAPST